MIRLYELAMADGASISPYVWRIRYALAHKALSFETRPVGFTQIPELFGGVYKTVPILEDGDRVVCDSFAIADYLDGAYPERPMLFSSPAERGLAQFVDRWGAVALVPHLAAICIPDIHARVRPEDRDYFRTSREARTGVSFDTMIADRQSRISAFRESLQPARLTLRIQPFLSGNAAGYADFILAGLFIWGGSVSPAPLLAPDDPLIPWLTRCLSLYDGVGETPVLKALPGSDSR
jgi:glutathione S-transferase